MTVPAMGGIAVEASPSGGSHPINLPAALGVEIPLPGTPLLAAWCPVNNLVALALDHISEPVGALLPACPVVLFNPAIPDEYVTLEAPLQGSSDSIMALEWSPQACRRVLLSATRCGSLCVWDQLQPDAEDAAQVPCVNRWWGHMLPSAAPSAAAAAGPLVSGGTSSSALQQPLVSACWLAGPASRQWSTAALLDPDSSKSERLDHVFYSERCLSAGPGHWVRPTQLVLSAVTCSGQINFWWSTHYRCVQQLTWRTCAGPLLVPDIAPDDSVCCVSMTTQHPAAPSPDAASRQPGGPAAAAQQQQQQQHGSLAVALVLASQRDAVRIVRVEGHPLLAGLMYPSGQPLSPLTVSGLMNITLPAGRPVACLAWRPASNAADLYVGAWGVPPPLDTVPSADTASGSIAGGTKSVAASCPATCSFESHVHVECYQGDGSDIWHRALTATLTGVSGRRLAHEAAATANQTGGRDFIKKQSVATAGAAGSPFATHGKTEGGGSLRDDAAASCSLRFDAAADGTKLLLLLPGRQARVLCCDSLQQLDICGDGCSGTARQDSAIETSNTPSAGSPGPMHLLQPHAACLSPNATCILVSTRRPGPAQPSSAQRPAIWLAVHASVDVPSAGGCSSCQVSVPPPDRIPLRSVASYAAAMSSSDALLGTLSGGGGTSAGGGATPGGRPPALAVMDMMDWDVMDSAAGAFLDTPTAALGSARDSLDLEGCFSAFLQSPRLRGATSPGGTALQSGSLSSLQEAVAPRPDPARAAAAAGLSSQQQAARLDALRLAWAALDGLTKWDVVARVQAASRAAGGGQHIQLVLDELERWPQVATDQTYKARLSGLLEIAALQILQVDPRPSARAVTCDIAARRIISHTSVVIVKCLVPDVAADGQRSNHRSLAADDWATLHHRLHWCLKYFVFFTRCCKLWVNARLNAESTSAAVAAAETEAATAAAFGDAASAARTAAAAQAAAAAADAAMRQAEQADSLPCIRLLYDSINFKRMVQMAQLWYVQMRKATPSSELLGPPPAADVAAREGDMKRSSAMHVALSTMYTTAEEAFKKLAEEGLRADGPAAEAAAACGEVAPAPLSTKAQQLLKMAELEALHSLIRGPYRLPLSRLPSLLTLPALVATFNGPAFNHVADLSMAQVDEEVQRLQLSTHTGASTWATAGGTAGGTGGGTETDAGRHLTAVDGERQAESVLQDAWMVYRPAGPDRALHAATLAPCSSVSGSRKRRLEALHQAAVAATGASVQKVHRAGHGTAGSVDHNVNEACKAGRNVHGGAPLDLINGRPLDPRLGWAYETADGLHATDELTRAKLLAASPAQSISVLRRGWQALAPVAGSAWRRVGREQ